MKIATNVGNSGKSIGISRRKSNVYWQVKKIQCVCNDRSSTRVCKGKFQQMLALNEVIVDYS